MLDEHLNSLQPGTVIGGKYEVVKCLGSGSMGMVYACRHRDLQGQMVAAKVLFHDVAADAVSAARFRNEVLASYGVSHPNVVRAYEFIKDGDLVAYTMEFVGGGDLADRISRAEVMPIPEFIKFLSQMTAGVQAIHDAGIVHRDLKPENILISNDGSIKIADFGIARNKNGPKLTEHGGVVGTIEYVAPEYLLRSQVDWRSDIYALGVLAYEMITGKAPFTGDSHYASVSKRLQEDPEPPSLHRNDCPAQIDAIILKALEREPVKRYQSAIEMFHDLQKAAEQLGIPGVNSSGLYMTSGAQKSAEPYIGPSLSESSSPGNEALFETQLLTSDGALEPSAAKRGGAGDAAWQASPVGAHSHGIDELERSVSDLCGVSSATQRDGRTEVLSAAEAEYSLLASHARRFTKPQAAEPFAGSDSVSQIRGEFRGRHRGYQRAVEFPVNILRESHKRLRILDLFTMALAAVIGVACGFFFLKIFAPSFLEKLRISIGVS